MVTECSVTVQPVMVKSISLSRRELLHAAIAAGLGATLVKPSTAAAATASYDDGGTAVPKGLAGDPERVIVIGAGWAGLTLANALQNAGVDHVVLEGRERIGGRANTVDIGGFPVDLGCSWIHQPIGNPMARFAEQAGVARRNANIELDIPIIRFYDAYLDRPVGPLHKVLSSLLAANFAFNESATIADHLGPNASVRAGAQVYLDRYWLGGSLRRQTEFWIRTLSEFPQGTDWDRLALHDWAGPNQESTYQGVGEGDFPEGGYRRLYEAMAGSGDVRFNHRVEAIEVGETGVVVRATAGGESVTYEGSHVVVTVPLGVLKRDSIRFEPELPEAKREVIARIGFAAVEKVAMIFDEPFWHDLLHTHIVYLSDHAPLEFPMCLDLQRISGFPALVAFCGGPFAEALHRMSPDEALALALERLSEIFRCTVPTPRDFAVTNWQADPFSCGSYSTTLVGGSADDRDVLAEPVLGRLLFAGEATSRTRRSTADGAMSSGIREAKRLLRSPSVVLSAG